MPSVVVDTVSVCNKKNKVNTSTYAEVFGPRYAVKYDSTRSCDLKMEDGL